MILNCYWKYLWSIQMAEIICERIPSNAATCDRRDQRLDVWGQRQIIRTLD
jgi:hypothetical protein